MRSEYRDLNAEQRSLLNGLVVILGFYTGKFNENTVRKLDFHQYVERIKVEKNKR